MTKKEILEKFVDLYSKNNHGTKKSRDIFERIAWEVSEMSDVSDVFVDANTNEKGIDEVDVSVQIEEFTLHIRGYSEYESKEVPWDEVTFSIFKGEKGVYAGVMIIEDLCQDFKNLCNRGMKFVLKL